MAETPAPPATSGRFDGSYVGLSGNFGGANETSFSSDRWTGSSQFRLNTPSLGLFAGYNQHIGGFVLGVEGSIRGDVASKTARTFQNENVTTLPMRSGWQWSSYPINSGSGTRYEDSGPMVLASYFRETVSIKEVASPMISARAGVGLGPVLLYGRAGLGASLMQAKTESSINETTCGRTPTRVDFTPNYEERWILDCIDRDEYTIRQTEKRDRLVPTFAAAAGAEYHHDRYFGRLEAEARYIHWGNQFLPSGESGTMRYTIGMGVGVRF